MSDLDTLIDLQQSLGGKPFQLPDVLFYSELLRRMVSVLGHGRAYRDSVKSYAESEEYKKLANDLALKWAGWIPKFRKEHHSLLKEADDLLFFMLDNIPDENGEFSPESHYQIDDLFSGRLKTAAILSSVPSLMVMEKSVVATLVLKDMISVQKFPFDTMIMKGFDVFSARYKPLLMGQKKRPANQIAQFFPQHCVNKGMTIEEVERLAKSTDMDSSWVRSKIYWL